MEDKLGADAVIENIKIYIIKLIYLIKKVTYLHLITRYIKKDLQIIIFLGQNHQWNRKEYINREY